MARLWGFCRVALTLLNVPGRDEYFHNAGKGRCVWPFMNPSHLLAAVSRARQIDREEVYRQALRVSCLRRSFIPYLLGSCTDQVTTSKVTSRMPPLLESIEYVHEILNFFLQKRKAVPRSTAKYLRPTLSLFIISHKCLCTSIQCYIKTLL